MQETRISGMRCFAVVFERFISHTCFVDDRRTVSRRAVRRWSSRCSFTSTLTDYNTPYMRTTERQGLNLTEIGAESMEAASDPIVSSLEYRGTVKEGHGLREWRVKGPLGSSPRKSLAQTSHSWQGGWLLTSRRSCT